MRSWLEVKSPVLNSGRIFPCTVHDCGSTDAKFLIWTLFCGWAPRNFGGMYWQ